MNKLFKLFKNKNVKKQLNQTRNKKQQWLETLFPEETKMGYVFIENNTWKCNSYTESNMPKEGIENFIFTIREATNSEFITLSTLEDKIERLKELKNSKKVRPCPLLCGE